jgi:hypothetical protein
MRAIRYPVVWAFLVMALLVAAATVLVAAPGTKTTTHPAPSPTESVDGVEYFYENYTILLHLGPIPVNCSKYQGQFGGSVTFEGVQFFILETANCLAFQNISVWGIEPSGVEFSHLFGTLPVYGEESNWTAPDRVFGVQLYVTGVYGLVEPRVLVAA